MMWVAIVYLVVGLLIGEKFLHTEFHLYGIPAAVIVYLLAVFAWPLILVMAVYFKFKAGDDNAQS
jgi:hypothetical protein